MRPLRRANHEAWNVGTLLVGMMTVWGVSGAAHAIALDTTHSVAGAYPTAGGTVDVTVTITTSGTGTLLSLGLNETIPTGWTYNSLVSGPAPVIEPTAGASGPLDFAWSTVPTFPMTFVYRLNVPAGGTTTKTVSGYALGMDDLGQNIESTPTTVDIDADAPTAMPLRTWPILLCLLIVGVLASRWKTRILSRHLIRE